MARSFDGKRKSGSRPSDAERISAPLGRKLLFEALEPRILLSADTKPIAAPAIDARESGPGQVFVLDLDGASGVDYDGPVRVDNISLPAFAAPGDLAGQEGAVIAALIATLEIEFAGTDILFSLEAPQAGEFSTIFVG